MESTIDVEVDNLDEASVVAETEFQVDPINGQEANSQDVYERVQEACMEIVPYIVQPEISKGMETKDEYKLYMDRGEDILQRTRMLSCFQCPPIPLCRLIPYAKVRGLRDDVSGLKAAFGKEGYVEEKGAFIISLWTCHREETWVTENIMAEWDPIWRERHEEFEAEISNREEYGMLSNRMFYVWEGNHRTVAWQAAIKERFSKTKNKHYRVLCTVIDPTRVPEIALLTCLQRMNL